MANKNVYPFGIEGQLPSGYPIVNDKTTGGADKAWSAEQGKLACVEIDKNMDNIFRMNATELLLSDYTANNNWTINSSNLWSKGSGNNNASELVPIVPGQRYRVYGQTIIAMLKSDSMVNGNSPDFCTGYTGRISVSDIYDVIAPEDAAFMYVLTKSGGTSLTVSLRTSPANYDKVIVNNTESIYRMNVQVMDTDGLIHSGVIDNTLGSWSLSGSAACILYPITGGEKYVICANTTNNFYAFLTSNSISAGTAASFCDGYSSTMRILAGEHIEFTAPADAKFLYLRLSTTGGTLMDSYAGIPKTISEQFQELGLGTDETKDKFDTPPEYFAWKKAEQMLNLKWTPLKAVPKSTTGNFSADSEVTGTPYSSVAEYDKRLGEDVSFLTFMTALHNPYSLLYTENVRYSTSQSAYGVQYYGGSNCAMYYGVVCSGFTSYALGTIPYVTGQYDDLAESGVFEKVYDQSANGVMRGDLLWQEGHTLFVQDVWRKNGVVTRVRVTEEWQPLARVRGVYTATEFNSFLSAQHIIIYRYKELYKNINYEQSPFVTVGDEVALPAFTYNDDICTFAGDRASFAEGDLIYIHCLNLAYPQMEIYKDNVLLETITLASDSRAALTSDNLAYAVNLSNDNLTYGKYKCRLKDGDTYSDYTYFEIINAVVTVDEDYDIASYSSANGKAEFWYFCKYHSTQGANVYKGLFPLNGGSSGTIDVSDHSSTHPLLKVLFRGEYGRVAGRYLYQDQDDQDDDSPND